MNLKFLLPLLAIVTALSLTPAQAQNTPASADASASLAPDQVEANYTKAIEGRTDAILKLLALDDATKTTTVHDTIMAQYRALKAWHLENDAKLKAARRDTNAVAQIRVSLLGLHADFLAKLATVLTPEQIDVVKDKMTYGKVQFTYQGYVTQYTTLTDAQKQKILELLKDAREEAMDGGSAEEKTAVFQRYKGKINNYLSHQGLHPGKPKANAATNAPINEPVPR